MIDVDAESIALGDTHICSSFTDTHTHTHTHIYVYIYIYIYKEEGSKAQDSHSEESSHCLECREDEDA